MAAGGGGVASFLDCLSFVIVRCHIGSMIRRIFLLAPLVLAAGPPLSPPDARDVARVETYLTALRTLKARFLQVGPDGRTSEGTAWIDRPGRMRFEYDPPSPLLLVAGHGLVVFHDKQLVQTTNFLIGQTPLGILLGETITIGGDVTVTGIERSPGQLQVTLVRTGSPGDGSLALIFADNPLALKQWAVIDAQRQETRVSLFNVELGGKFESKLFEFIDPRLLGPVPNNQAPGNR